MKVFYHPNSVADIGSHISPSSLKPRLLVEYLTSRGYTVPLVDNAPLTEASISLSHDPDYVRDILAGRELNGFANRSPAVAASLPYTSGSMFEAAQTALHEGIAVSFSSGFHHASYASSGGFCTFNGLTIAAILLHRQRKVERVMILDCDFHYGNGTDDIKKLLHLAWLRHETLGQRFHTHDQSQAYLDRLVQIFESLEKEPVDLILYQAGADVHVNDPLGGLLSSAQMQQRDTIVFRAARQLGIPIAWNLAGGYQRDEDQTILPVLRLHEQTYRIARESFTA